MAKENLATDSVEQFFHHKRAPKTKFAAKRSGLIFKLIKTYILPKSGKTWFRFFGKKSFRSDTDTEIGPWFPFPIRKPGFGRTLLHCSSLSLSTVPAVYDEFGKRVNYVFGLWLISN